ncbi:hypothetical protein DFH11DRAFT_1605506 [Phellopilus nigrolimitatus]|nr:hypothetical protein DFH11DRAFT_1605506 [Phellopilus nigrolimitatus]
MRCPDPSSLRPLLTYSMAGFQILFFGFVAVRRATDLRDKGRTVRYMSFLNCTKYAEALLITIIIYNIHTKGA